MLFLRHIAYESVLEQARRSLLNNMSAFSEHRDLFMAQQASFAEQGLAAENYLGKQGIIANDLEVWFVFCCEV